MRLTDRERNTILAALRLFQRQDFEGVLSEEILDIATNGGEDERMHSADIDRLCERINR